MICFVRVMCLRENNRFAPVASCGFCLCRLRAGAYVSLLEYNNIEGMILLSELSRRRIRSINKLIRVGRIEYVVVLRVDKEKGRRGVSSFFFSSLLLPATTPQTCLLSDDTPPGGA